MADNPLDTVPGAFELRMEKRRRMFNATGAHLSEDSNFKAQFTKRMRPWYVLFEFKEIANANG